jgi:hypothetical protein
VSTLPVALQLHADVDQRHYGDAARCASLAANSQCRMYACAPPNNLYPHCIALQLAVVVDIGRTAWSLLMSRTWSSF